MGTLHYTADSKKRGVVLSTLNVGSESFGAPMPVFGVRTGTNPVPDKEWIAVNNFPNTPNLNRLAAAFTLEPPSITASGGMTSQSYFTYSNDGGHSWSPTNRIGPLNTSGSQVLLLPDGALVVIYWHFLNGYEMEGSSRIELQRSGDGGQTFGAPVTVASIPQLYEAPNTLNGNFFPSACSDRQAGVLYVTYNAVTNSTPLIMFTRSIDKGTTWSKPIKVNDTPGRKSVFNPAIAATPDGQHVTIVFYDTRNDPSGGLFVDAYLAESFDGGITWEGDVRLSEFPSDMRFAPKLMDLYSVGEYFGIVPALSFSTPGAAVWIDTRSGDPDPYLARITRTKGAPFEAWRKLRFSTNDLANATVSGENADTDGDGIPNLAEYAFGLEPGHPDQSPLRVFRSGPASAYRIAYERLAVLSAIRFEWQTSTDLINWTTLVPPLEIVGPGRDPSMEHVDVGFSGGCGDACFFCFTLQHSP